MALALGVLFGFGVLLVVGNTIRLAVESRRREIEVVMLIGATHASYVARSCTVEPGMALAAGFWRWVYWPWVITGSHCR